MGRKKQHRFHGDPKRFDVIAEFVNDKYGKTIKYIADVAGGQGMLCRILNKRYNYKCEVIDPRQAVRFVKLCFIIICILTVIKSNIFIQ